MTLDPYQERLLDFVTGRMDEADRTAFLQKQAARGKDAADLVAEADALRALWDGLGRLPEPEPSPELRAHFYQMLHAEMAAAARPSPLDRLNTWLDRWWPRQPAMQAGLALALLLVGLGLGALLDRDTAVPAGEVVALRGEVSELRQMMAVSLLQQASAAERLRGITWSYRVAQPDSQVVGALLNTLNYDPNVSVRLAAVDAFQTLAPQLPLADDLAASLRRQESPLVQLALIDLLVAIQAEQARSVLRELMEQESLPPEVRAHAEAGMRAL